jgi:hypothetical protein
VANGDTDAVFREQFLGLIFVNVHGASIASREENLGAAPPKHGLRRLKSAASASNSVIP